MLTKEELQDLYKSSCLSREDFNLICLTFNVNARIEEEFDTLLSQVLKSNAETLPDIFVIGLQEVIPLNAQNVIGANIFSESEETIDRWLWLILTALSRIEAQYDAEQGTVNPYELLIKEHMVGLWICVIVSKSIRPAIRCVQKASCPRGVGGMFGNKGATCVRFDIHDSSICLINAHFAAHRGHVKQRNQDFHAILHREMFSDPLLASSHSMHSAGESTSEMQALQQSLSSLRKKIEHYTSEECQATSAHEGRDSLVLRRESSTSISSSSHLPQDNQERFSSLVEEDGATSRTTIGRSDGYGDSALSPSEQSPPISNVPSSAASSLLANPLQSAIIEDECKLSPDDHDIIIWLGDLNYRIDSAIPDEYVFELIESARLDELAELDQLNIEKDRGEVFEGFHEGLLNFPPTYKYIRTTDEYDRRPEKKVRCPSWCDRVLWRTTASQEQERLAFADPNDQFISRVRSAGSSISCGPGLPLPCENIGLMCYSRGNSSISDHKPVYASLNVKTKRIDWAASEQMLLDVMQELCCYDGDLREALIRSGGAPLLLEPASINLHSLPPVGDNVHIRLTNKLDCAICYNFKESSVPVWAHVDPLSSTIPPGKAITLSVTVNHLQASAAYGDEVCKSDAMLDNPSANHLLQLSERPEITALLVLQLKALREKSHAESESWKVLEQEFVSGGFLADLLLPCVCFLGAPVLDDSRV